MTAETLNVDGTALRLTLHRESADQWHWVLVAPGKLILSGAAVGRGDAAVQARNCAVAWLSQQNPPLRGRQIVSAQ